MRATIVGLTVFFGVVFGNPLLKLVDPEERIDLSHLGPEIFGVPNDKVGEKLNEWKEGNGINAEEAGEYAEGDILMPRPLGRSGIAAESARWPNATVPYEIAGRFSSSDLNMISAAMDDYHEMTCVRFRPRSTMDTDYLSITSSRSGCWSSVGRIGGRQELNLQSPGCLTKKGTIIHELMHAMGFLHEQNRSERDHHVTINWGNIQRNLEGNFKKAKKEDTNAFGVQYDYRSVMHYSGNAFSSNGKPTIVPKINGVELGQREGFSRHDVLKIKKMYKCP